MHAWPFVVRSVCEEDSQMPDAGRLDVDMNDALMELESGLEVVTTGFTDHDGSCMAPTICSAIRH